MLVDCNIEYVFCMMDEGLCGLPQEQAMERLPGPTVSTILNHPKIIKGASRPMECEKNTIFAESC